MYYVISSSYVGENANQHVDSDCVTISTTPAGDTQNSEDCHTGHCGTSNGFSVSAHGSYLTEDAAKAHILKEFGICREVNRDEIHEGEHVVAMYKVGQHQPLSEDATQAWIYDAVQKQVTADSTSIELAQLEDKLEESANKEGFTLSGSMDYMLKVQDERRECFAEEF